MLQIETDFISTLSPLYRHILEMTLPKLLPQSLSSLEQETEITFPIVKSEHLEDGNPHIVFYCLWRGRQHAFRFIYDVLHSWLVPFRPASLQIATTFDFRLPSLSQESYTYGYFDISIAAISKNEQQALTLSLPSLLAQLRLGIESRYHAWRLLEVKGLNINHKADLIQAQINYLHRKLPESFDRGLVTEMQHMLVLFRDEFIALRESRHLSRLISVQYYFRRQLLDLVEKAPQQRFLKIKLYRTKLRYDNIERPVVGILVGINFIGEQELFEEKHLMKAIRRFLNNVVIVKDSCIIHRRGTDSVSTLYLEIEKEDGTEFLPCEIALLRSELPYDLKDRIERLLHPVFMPHNEEEILRNILNLSNQIKYANDPPQAFITFDEQMRDNLIFTVIMVSVGVPGEASLAEKMQKAETPLEFIHDRCKMIGMLRKKYAKEANVFRLKFSKLPFIRENGTIDLNRARQHVVDELSRHLGEFRDYNGGMISTQNELMRLLRNYLDAKPVRYNDLLLENFFFALKPVELRTLIDIELIAELFIMLIDVISEGLFKSESNLLRNRICKGSMLLIVNLPALVDPHHLAQELQIKFEALAYTEVQVYGVPYLCCVLRDLSEGELQRCQHRIKERQPLLLP